MFNSKFSNLLNVLLIISIVAIIGILGYLGYSLYNKYSINAGAKNIVNDFEDIAKKRPVEDYGINMIIDEGDVNSIYERKKTIGKVMYNGYVVIGTLSIPEIKIEYPVLEKVTTNSLKIAVAYLSGPGINKVREYSYSRT